MPAGQGARRVKRHGYLIARRGDCPTRYKRLCVSCALHGCEVGFTQGEVADLLGVSRETVCRWWSAYTSIQEAAPPLQESEPRRGPRVAGEDLPGHPTPRPGRKRRKSAGATRPARRRTRTRLRLRPQGASCDQRGAGQPHPHNKISAISNKGTLRFMTYIHHLDRRVVHRLLGPAGGGGETEIFLIVDRLKAHDACAATTGWPSTRSDRVVLPASYSPELDPDEYLNNDLKGGVNKAGLPDNKQDLRGTLVWPDFNKESFTTVSGDFYAPTHWMPLPPPPAERAKDKR